MRLVKAQVRLFRNIVDSGWVEVERDVTSLLGKNESGKTAFLQGLYSLNPAYEADVRFDVKNDYPRWRKTRDARELDLETVAPVRATFELEEAEIRELSEELTIPLPARVTLTMSRRYDGTADIHMDVSQRDLMPLLLQSVTLGGGTKAAFEGCRTPTDLAGAAREELSRVPKEERETAKALRQLAAAAEAAAELLAGGLAEDAAEAVLARIPKFFYFSEFSALKGRTDLTVLLAKAKKRGAKLEEHERTVLSLLRLAGVGGDELLDEDFESRVVELEAAANELSNEVFRYWTQNRDVRVSLISDAAAVHSGRKDVNIHRFLDVRLHDLRHQVTTNLEARSPGFRWFFSFITAFSEFEREKNVIILLDEPGRGLHARAQCDLLRFIDERVAAKNQILYTTHSSFMVDPVRLERLRVVEDCTTRDNPGIGTKVSKDIAAANEDTLLPFKAALGYELSRSLLAGPVSLLVESSADSIYLKTMSEHLAGLGRESLDARWTVTPLGGLDKVASFATLAGSAAELAVVGEARTVEAEGLAGLVERGLVKHDRIVTVGDDASAGETRMEDLFEPPEYLELCNKAFGTELSGTDVAGGGSILDRLQTRLGEAVAPAAPAAALVGDKESFLGNLSPTTLDRFEDLIRRINATLGEPGEAAEGEARSDADEARAEAPASKHEPVWLPASPAQPPAANGATQGD